MLKKIISFMMLSVMVFSLNTNAQESESNTINIINNTDISVQVIDCGYNLGQTFAIPTGQSSIIFKNSFADITVNIIPVPEDLAMLSPDDTCEFNEALQEWKLNSTVPVIMSFQTNSVGDQVTVNGSYANQDLDYDYNLNISNDEYSKLIFPTDTKGTFDYTATSPDGFSSTPCINDNYGVNTNMTYNDGEMIKVQHYSYLYGCTSNNTLPFSLFPIIAGKRLVVNIPSTSVDSFDYDIYIAQANNPLITGINALSQNQPGEQRYPTPALCVNGVYTIEPSSGAGYYSNVQVGDDIYLPIPGDTTCQYIDQYRRTVISNGDTFYFENLNYQPATDTMSATYDDGEFIAEGFKSGLLFQVPFPNFFGLIGDEMIDYANEFYSNQKICANGELVGFSKIYENSDSINVNDQNLYGFYIPLAPGNYDIAVPNQNDCQNPRSNIANVTIIDGEILQVYPSISYNSTNGFVLNTIGAPIVRTGSDESDNTNLFVIQFMFIMFVSTFQMLLEKEQE